MQASNDKKAKLRIATLNVRSLGTQDKELELQNALSNMKFDVLGLSEVRKYGEAIIENPEEIYSATLEKRRGIKASDL